jgi:hypothetical protein
MIFELIEPVVTICSFIAKKITNDHHLDPLYIPLHVQFWYLWFI